MSQRFFVHVYRVVRFKFGIEAADHQGAMDAADEQVGHAVNRLEYSMFGDLDIERDNARRVELPIHLATEDAEETEGYLIDHVDDEDYSNSVHYNGDGTLLNAPKPKLFFVACDDGNGESLDAIVEAMSPADAQLMWANQWEWDLTATDRPQPRIWEINPTGKTGVLGWNTKQLNRMI